MTAKPQSQPPPPPAPAEAAAPTVTPKANAVKKAKGDVHVGSMAGDVKRVPGVGTAKGEKAIADLVRDLLDQVRRSILQRTNRRS